MNTIHSIHPLTNSGHIILSGIQTMEPAMHSFLSSLYSKNAEVHTPVTVGLNLTESVRYLASGVDGTFPTRILLLETRSGHTAVFNNAWRSEGWFEMVFPLVKTIDVTDIYFGFQRNTIRKAAGKLQGQYGAVQFIKTSRGEIVRSISLVNDGGRWVFTTQGTPLPFEDLDAYEAPRKADRFTHAMLEQYLGALDLHPFQDDFYIVDKQHPSIGIEIEITLPPGSQDDYRPIDIEAVRERYGPFE